ncbi:MAG: SDR family oxidoreductase [Pseudomonadales bacterium]|nr:SDR family oxidoreductase [Pseudomonadales bacterium]
MRLEDKVALITGAGAGIGRASALAMAREGATVAVVDIDGDKVDSCVTEIQQAGGTALGIIADVSNLEEIDSMVSSVVEKYGQLDVMFNNAGVTRRCKFMDIDEELWDWVHDVNAKGVFFCIKRAAETMIKQGHGSIINTASIAGRGFPGTSNAAYAASKGAVIALTMQAARSLGRHNINVNSICPGVTRTELMQGILNKRHEKEGIPMDELEAQAARGITIGRINEASDIAEMAVFLASPAARNITGQSINVDGGLVMI